MDYAGKALTFTDIYRHLLRTSTWDHMNDLKWFPLFTNLLPDKDLETLLQELMTEKGEAMREDSVKAGVVLHP